MGLALLVVIWLITLVSTYFFAAKTWWMPEGASTVAPAIDSQLTFTYITMGAVFILAQFALGYFAWKFRDRPGAAQVQYSHGHTRLEVTWIALTAVLFIGLNLMGTDIWAETRFRAPEEDAVRVEITGQQFAWYFRYPGPDGKFGRTLPKLIDPALGNEAAIGLDESDPAAADDIVSSTLVVPVNRQVAVILRAQDVIHNFFIPAMRFKQDAVPGMAITMHFTPNKVGDYEAACAELCGLGHYNMRALVRVVEEEEYQAWLEERLAEKEY